ncbi:MAG: acetolactate synthase small subunit [Lutibacter sp.]
MEEKQNYTVSVYTENNVGLLNRLSAIFLKRHINIESLSVSQSEIPDVHRFTFLVNISQTLIKKIVLQLEKQIEVIAAHYHKDDEVIYQETAMFKLSTKYMFDERIQNKLKLRRAHVVAITEHFFVIEATGFKEDIDHLYERLKPYGLLQFVRSGRVAITRPKMAISEILGLKNK